MSWFALTWHIHNLTDEFDLTHTTQYFWNDEINKSTHGGVKDECVAPLLPELTAEVAPGSGCLYTPSTQGVRDMCHVGSRAMSICSRSRGQAPLWHRCIILVLKDHVFHLFG